MVCFEQLPTLSEARKLGAGTGKDAWGQESQAVEQGLGGPGGRVFLEYLLPFHYLVVRLDTSPPCPKPHHPNSLPSPLQAQIHCPCPSLQEAASLEQTGPSTHTPTTVGSGLGWRKGASC